MLFIAPTDSKRLEVNLLRFHKFFYVLFPKIYIVQSFNVFGFGLHSHCDICKKWMYNYIVSYKNKEENIKIIAENNYKGINRVIIVTYPKITSISYLCKPDRVCDEIAIFSSTMIEILQCEAGNIFVKISIKEIEVTEKDKYYIEIKNEVIQYVI